MSPLSLPVHLFIHFILAVLVGYLVGRRCQRVEIGIIAGILGGFFIDLDHILEYFLVFGPHFNLTYFLEGRQFLASDKIHLWFHAWEYIPFFLILAWLWRDRKAAATFLLALALSGFIHLVSDCLINQYSPRNYSLFYRAQNDFAAPRLLSPEQYYEYQSDRQELGI